MIEITPAAAAQIRTALSDSAESGLALRVAVRRDGDGGAEYGMGLDERRDQDEEVITESGITLLVSPPSLEAISEMVIDFVEIEPGEHRFIFYRRGDIPAQPDSAA
jgi:iron-sulfur cluster assembly protein